jgi:hypothetical protein
MHPGILVRAVVALAAVAALAASGPVGAPVGLGVTAEAFAARWAGCVADGRGPTVIRCGDGVRARLADGRVAEVTKAFDPPVGLIDAKAWTIAALPSDAEIDAPATVDDESGIVSERYASVGLGHALGTGPSSSATPRRPTGAASAR